MSFGDSQFDSLSLSLDPDAELGSQRIETSSGAITAESTFIAGTSISVRALLEEISRFLHTFDDGKYIRSLKENYDVGLEYLNVSLKEVERFSAELYKRIVGHPQELIPLFDIVASQTLTRELGMGELYIQCRPFDLLDEDTKLMRDVEPEDIGRLVSFKGMVVRSSPVLPDLREAYFRCTRCGASLKVPVTLGKIEDPQACSECGKRQTHRLVHNLSRFSDKQIVKVQETPDMIPEGSTPQNATVLLYDDLVEVPKPGDKVEIVGIFRVAPVRKTSRSRVLRSVFRTYVDAVHIRVNSTLSKERFSDENLDSVRSVRAEKKYRGMGSDPEIYARLVDSFAPSIFGMDDVKRGVLCLLFGGASKDFDENDISGVGGAGNNRKSGGRVREQMNVLLVGDPGTSKSQMLKYVDQLSPRGIYTSGKGSSAVGLTAYVTKDPDTGTYVLESGALVLSDGGVCCIDEFDKMSDQTRSVLHEAMEQQTVTVTKAGIITTLNARASILASANPVESRYNPKLSVIQNIRLQPTLLSRFDLIYLVLDTPNEETDRRLAEHILDLFVDSAELSEDEREFGAIRQERFSQDVLSGFIDFARANCSPRLSDEASTELVDAYVELRNIGKRENVISATPRQLESLIRISEALAKMRLSEIVTIEDVKEAVRLMKTSMKEYATDPESGKIDMDLVTTGISAHSRRLVGQIATILKSDIGKYIPAVESPVRFRDIVDQLQEISAGIDIDGELVREALRSMAEEGSILIQGNPRRGNFVVRRLV